MHSAIDNNIQVYHQKGVIRLPPSALIPSFKTKWFENRGLFNSHRHVLIDCRTLDLSEVPLLDFDTFATDVQTDLAGCIRLAIVHRPEGSTRFIQHFANICFNHGVDSRVFSEIEQALEWLNGIHENLNLFTSETETHGQ